MIDDMTADKKTVRARSDALSRIEERSIVKYRVLRGGRRRIIAPATDKRVANKTVKDKTVADKTVKSEESRIAILPELNGGPASGLGPLFLICGQGRRVGGLFSS